MSLLFQGGFVRSCHQKLVVESEVIAPATKRIKCHAGPRIASGAGSDPASRLIDSGFRHSPE
jgi:hypothetical protein